MQYSALLVHRLHFAGNYCKHSLLTCGQKLHLSVYRFRQIVAVK